MRKILYICSLICLTLLNACSGDVKVTKNIEEELIIFPDYKGVTIPVNVAPLDFYVENVGDMPTVLQIAGDDEKMIVKGDDGNFVIPQRKWKRLLEKQQGKDIQLTVCKKENGEWCAYKPFFMNVVSDKIDKYIAYRLIPPGYGLWNKMGIYERSLETYEQIPIYENKLTDYNCVNCHSFPMQSPDKMLFHMRSKHCLLYHI